MANDQVKRAALIRAPSMVGGGLTTKRSMKA